MSIMKKLGVGLLLIVTVVVAVGVTYSLLKYRTDTINNSFTSSENISIQLREPNWDGYEFDQEYIGIPGSQKDPADQNLTLGIDKASQYMPGDSIEKNPMIKNDSQSQDAYVAIKVEFIGTDKQKITKDKFEELYGTLTMSTDFTLIESNEDYEVYMYNSVLTHGNQTVALFENVLVNKDIQLVDGKLPSFQINTKGLAVQSVHVIETDAKNELIALANSI